MCGFYKILEDKFYNDCESVPEVFFSDTISLIASENYTNIHSLARSDFLFTRNLHYVIENMKYDLMIRSHKSDAFNILHAKVFIKEKKGEYGHGIQMCDDSVALCSDKFAKVAALLLYYFKKFNKLPEWYFPDIWKQDCKP